MYSLSSPQFAKIKMYNIGFTTDLDQYLKKVNRFVRGSKYEFYIVNAWCVTKTSVLDRLKEYVNEMISSHRIDACSKTPQYILRTYQYHNLIRLVNASNARPVTRNKKNSIH